MRALKMLESFFFLANLLEQLYQLGVLPAEHVEPLLLGFSLLVILHKKEVDLIFAHWLDVSRRNCCVEQVIL